jgi:hypothetical protein
MVEQRGVFLRKEYVPAGRLESVQVWIGEIVRGDVNRAGTTCGSLDRDRQIVPTLRRWDDSRLDHQSRQAGLMAHGMHEGPLHIG